MHFLLISCILIALQCVVGHTDLSADYSSELKEYASKSVKSEVSLKELEARKHFDVNEDYCLSGAGNPLGIPRLGKEIWFPQGQEKREMLQGTTYWVNDFMAVGHMMYDVHLLQLLNSTRIDRIILQRAPCATSDLCQGSGTFTTFFKGFYSAMIEAAGSQHTQLYVRFQKGEKEWLARSLNTNKNNHWDAKGGVEQIHEVHTQAPPVRVSDVLCFDKVIRRRKQKDFWYGVSPELAIRFKQVAHANADLELHKAGKETISEAVAAAAGGGEFRVTIAHRGNSHYREMRDPVLVKTAIEKMLQDNGLHTLKGSGRRVEVLLYDTSDPNLTQYDQVDVVGSSDAVICTHGAFESNIVYMQEGALLVEIRGSGDKYYDENATNFNHLANMFKVHYRSLVAGELKGMKDKEYSLADAEMEELVGFVRGFLEVKQQGH